MVIGCFYDPALQAAREISSNTVIIAPCQASIEIALHLGNTFSIIAGKTKWINQMRQTIYNYGYRDQLASFQVVGLGVEDFHKDPEKTKGLLQTAASEAIIQHGAEVIILGCTLGIGFYAGLQSYLAEEFSFQVPVIDSSIAALKAAENAALLKQLGWVNSRVKGMQPPPESELKKFAILQTDYKFGNIINIPAS